MKMRLLICQMLTGVGLSAFAQGTGFTAFTYQGRLSDGTNAATGSYDLRFALYDSLNTGAQQGSGITNFATPVGNGLFTVTLDFGNQFPGAGRWLEIAVRTNGTSSFVTLNPRQALAPAPYAITAGNVVSGGLAAGNYGNVVTFNNGNNSFSGAFSGNGANVTNVNAARLGGLSPASFWQTGGNAGANPAAGAFLGNADNLPLELRVNSQRVLRLEPASDVTLGFLPNVIGGHGDNFVAPGTTGAFIGGGGGQGLSNTIASAESVVAGGYLNHIEAGNAHASAIGGGFDNNIAFGAFRSVIAGGHGNRVGTNSEGSVISGGEVNSISAGSFQSAIGGGNFNSISVNSPLALIGGGYANDIAAGGYYSFVGGGIGNLTASNAYASVISGGAFNTNTGFYSAINGGRWNSSGSFASVTGGCGNNASGAGATVGGGYTNAATGAQATVNGGNQNSAAALQSTVAGGDLNVATEIYSTVGGGDYNAASGPSATVPGGYNNQASGPASFAAGQNAIAAQSGDFVWNSYDRGNVTVGPGQFSIFGQHGLNVDFYTQRADGGGSRWLYVGDSFAGSTITAWNGASLSDGGVWANASDKNRKTDFVAVNPKAILNQLAALPVREWRYTNEISGVKHLGPTAQDFKLAFGLGTDDKTIGTVDESGVALAAIQGLDQKLNEKDALIQMQATEIAKLKQSVAELKEMMASLAARK